MGGFSGAGWGGQGGMLVQSSPFNWLINGPSSANDPSANIEAQAGNMSGLADRLKELGADQWAKYESLYAPNERQFVKDAQTIDSAENQERAAGESAAQVRSSVAKAKEGRAREQASMGINPNSRRATSFNNQADMAQAAGEASAMDEARRIVKDRGITMRAGVVQQGNTVANNAMLANQTAMQGYGGSGNLSIGKSNADTSSFNATTTAGTARTQQSRGLINDILGSISGMGGFGSSKKIKTDKKTVSDEATLEAIKSIPVASWKYKPGAGDGKAHVGPYAEDVHAKFGDKAAPGGNTIDVISALGINMSAIKGLAKQVDALKSKVDELQGA